MGLELYWGDQVIQSLAILRARRVHLEQQQVTLLEQESPQILKKEGSLISTIFMWTIIVVVTGFVAWCVMYVRAYRLEHFGSKSSNEMSKVAAYGTPNFETASFDA